MTHNSEQVRLILKVTCKITRFVKILHHIFKNFSRGHVPVLTVLDITFFTLLCKAPQLWGQSREKSKVLDFKTHSALDFTIYHEL